MLQVSSYQFCIEGWKWKFISSHHKINKTWKRLLRDPLIKTIIHSSKQNEQYSTGRYLIVQWQIKNKNNAGAFLSYDPLEWTHLRARVNEPRREKCWQGQKKSTHPARCRPFILSNVKGRIYPWWLLISNLD